MGVLTTSSIGTSAPNVLFSFSNLFRERAHSISDGVGEEGWWGDEDPVLRKEVNETGEEGVRICEGDPLKKN